jgi:hypothetical protein
MISRTFKNNWRDNAGLRQYAQARHELSQQGYIETCRAINYPDDCDIELTAYFAHTDNQRLLDGNKAAIDMWFKSLDSTPDIDPTE